MDTKKLIELLGGPNNIDSFTHCITRLRFNIKDFDKVNKDEINKIGSVIGVQIKGGQLQVITQGNIESHFSKVQEELKKYSVTEADFVNENLDEPSGKKEKFGLNTILNHLAAILSPAIPAIAGGGLLKALYFFLTTFNIISADSNGAFILNIISDSMFFYLPFILAYTSAKRFETSIPLALSLAGVLMYPSLMNLAAEGGGTIDLFGFLPILVVNYKSSVIPIILSVACLKYVHKIASKYVPDFLNIILVPLLSLGITALVSLVVLAPIGFYLADYVAVLIEKIIGMSPFISGFIVGSTRPFLVLTGMHHALTPITLQQLDLYGYTTMGAMTLMSTFAQASAALAFWLFSKNKDDKKLGASSAITGYIGITEPILFGILVPNRDLFVITMLAGGVGGGVAAMLGGRAYGYVMPGILSLPAYMGDGFNGIIIGAIVTVLSTVVMYGIQTRRKK